MSAFRDVTKVAGIDFIHDPGAGGEFRLPEIMSGGGGFLDVDGDGYLDIYLVQSGSLTDEDRPRPPNRLYRNEATGSFLDVTEVSGAGDTGYGMGCAAADPDNDGDIDIYVTNVGLNVLLQNDGAGAFRDVSARFGIDHPGFGTSAVWFDYDLDGYLDLYVANYVLWSVAREGPCYAETGPRDYCTPLTYRPQGDVLYHNRGGTRLEDVTRASGVGTIARNGLGVVAGDFDGDGHVDLYVANDQQPNLLWQNRGDGTFRDNALESGCAVNADGMPEASMGIAVEDLDADGDLDLFVTHLRRETHTFYRNEGGTFEDTTGGWGSPSWSVRPTGFGTGFFDFDRDGRLDLFVANGAVNLGGEVPNRSRPYAEYDQLLWREPGGSLRDVTPRGEGLGRPLEVGRGASFGDVDNDGDVDLLVTNNRGPARLFRNEVSNDHRWILVQVVDRHGRDAIGARVTVEAGGRRQTREVRTHYSYLSSSDPRVHFGLGSVERIDRLTVQWPGGATTALEGVEVDRVLQVREGSPR